MAAIIRLAPPTAALSVDRCDAPATCNAPVRPGEVMSSPDEVGQGVLQVQLTRVEFICCFHGKTHLQNFISGNDVLLD
jgi:hypothetical protein